MCQVSRVHAASHHAQHHPRSELGHTGMCLSSSFPPLWLQSPCGTSRPKQKVSQIKHKHPISAHRKGPPLQPPAPLQQLLDREKNTNFHYLKGPKILGLIKSTTTLIIFSMLQKLIELIFLNQYTSLY